MKLKNHSRRQNRPSTGSSLEEAEVRTVNPEEDKKIKSLQSKTTSSRYSKRRHKSYNHDNDDDDYYQSATNFYAPSVVVETIYRRPQAFADLHQFDEVPEIDNVPTAVGFHSMDSAEEVVAARSTGKRYEMDEIPVVVKSAERDPSVKSANRSEVKRSITAATTETREEGEEEEEQEQQEAAATATAEEEDQATIDDDIRYGPVREAENGLPALDVIIKATHSDDSESCPPIWKSESQEEPRDRAWMIAEAKRVRELNAVTVPRKILKEYETSQIIRHPFVETSDRDKRSASGAGKKWSRVLRTLMMGGSASTDKNTNTNATTTNNNQTVRESASSPPPTTPSASEMSVTYGGGKDAESRVSRTSSRKSKGNASTTSKMQVQENYSSAASLRNDEERDDREDEKASYSSKGGSRISKSSTRYNQVQSVSSKDAMTNSSKDAMTRSSRDAMSKSSKAAMTTSSKDARTRSSKDGKAKSVSSKSRVTNNDDPPTQQEVIEELRDDRNVSSKETIQSESIFSLEESKPEGVTPAEYATKGPFEASNSTTQDNKDRLAAVSQSRDDHDDDDDGESTNMDGDVTQPQEDISVQESATTQGGYGGLTDWIINGFDNLANIGFNQPMFGFLDWSGEEKMIEKIEAATTAKGVTTEKSSGKKLPSKASMTKRVLSKEEIKARLMEGHARRQKENQANERNRERRGTRDPDGVPTSPRRTSRNSTSPRRTARPVTPSGSESVEVRTLTLDEGDDKQTLSQSRSNKSLADSTQQQKEGLTIQFPTPGFAKSSKQTSGRDGNGKDEDDTSKSLLGLEKKRNEKATKNQTSSSPGATKKSREEQQQSKNTKALFGPFRLQSKKQQGKP